MATSTRPTLRERARAAPARTSALAVGGVLLAAVWVILLVLSYRGLNDPEGTYRSSSFEATDPWSELDANDEAGSIRVIKGMAVGVGLVSILAMATLIAIVLTGRVRGVVSAIVATAIVLGVTVYLRSTGLSTTPVLLLGAVGWVAGTSAIIVGMRPGAARPAAEGLDAR